jgi:dihydrofolate synthase/folylpolyglutamate synthase
LIQLDNGRQLLLDGAHNPAGAEALSEALAEYSNRRIILLLGVMGDKDLNGILTPLLKRVQHIITVTPAQERAFRDTELAMASRSKGVTAEPAGTVAEGYKAAIKAANDGELIVAAGSLFLIGEIKALIAGIPCEAVRG